MPDSALPCTCVWCSARLWAGLSPASQRAFEARTALPWRRFSWLVLLRALLFLAVWWLVVSAHGPDGSVPLPARPPQSIPRP